MSKVKANYLEDAATYTTVQVVQCTVGMSVCITLAASQYALYFASRLSIYENRN